MKLNTTIYRKLRPTLIMFSVVFVLCIFAAGTLNAQPPGDPGGGTKPGEEVPITGIEILIAAGGALGIKKLMQRRKKDSV